MISFFLLCLPSPLVYLELLLRLSLFHILPFFTQTPPKSLILPRLNLSMKVDVVHATAFASFLVVLAPHRNNPPANYVPGGFQFSVSQQVMEFQMEKKRFMMKIGTNSGEVCHKLVLFLYFIIACCVESVELISRALFIF